MNCMLCGPRPVSVPDPCVPSHYLGCVEEQLHLLLVLDEVLYQLLTVPLPLSLEWLWLEQVGLSHRHHELV